MLSVCRGGEGGVRWRGGARWCDAVGCAVRGRGARGRRRRGVGGRRRLGVVQGRGAGGVARGVGVSCGSEGVVLKGDVVGVARPRGHGVGGRRAGCACGRDPDCRRQIVKCLVTPSGIW